MRTAGLAGASRRTGCETTRPDREARPAPDLVARKFEADTPDRRRFHTQAEARAAIFDFMEGGYNTHRRHSALD